MEFPLVGQPGGEPVCVRSRKIDQQLSEVQLRVDFMTAAEGWSGWLKDGRRPSPAWVAHEQRVFAIQDNTLHLPLACVVVDGHSAVGAEHAQLPPLA